MSTGRVFAAFADRVVRSLGSRRGQWRTRHLRRELAQLVVAIDDKAMVLISNNCVAGIMYEFAGLPKQSPTAGLYFTKMTYPRLLGDLAANEVGRWAEFDETALVFRADQNCWELPANDGEVVFLHYSSPGEAVAKWRRRIGRMSGRTPVVISSVQNETPCEAIVTAVQALPYALTVDGAPAPAADKIVLSPAFLRAACDFLKGVLNHDQLHVRILHRGRDYIAQDPHPHS